MKVVRCLILRRLQFSSNSSSSRVSTAAKCATGGLQTKDTELWELIQKERYRQKSSLTLIASEVRFFTCPCYFRTLYRKVSLSVLVHVSRTNIPRDILSQDIMGEMKL
uniref:SJCHGC03592 protein n=1 Tax=Schistosoma japonicum TaxID=6182 RepID=Q5DH62_SCHJA|nr:SJCHGC03592 protein [Schistosoma japonicum]